MARGAAVAAPQCTRGAAAPRPRRRGLGDSRGSSSSSFPSRSDGGEQSFPTGRIFEEELVTSVVTAILAAAIAVASGARRSWKILASFFRSSSSRTFSSASNSSVPCPQGSA